MNTEFKIMQFLAGLITKAQLNEQESFDIEQAREFIKQGKENFPLSKKLKIKKFPIEIRDSKGRILYYENSNREWYKYEFDLNNNLIYFEKSNGQWYKKEYDSKGNEIYIERSDGYIIDNRPKQK